MMTRGEGRGEHTLPVNFGSSRHDKNLAYPGRAKNQLSRHETSLKTVRNPIIIQEMLGS